MKIHSSHFPLSALKIINHLFLLRLELKGSVSNKKAFNTFPLSLLNSVSVVGSVGAWVVWVAWLHGFLGESAK